MTSRVTAGTVVGETGIHFAASGLIGNIAMHYLLMSGLVFASPFVTAYLLAVLGWGVFCAFFFGFVSVTSWRPLRVALAPVVSPCPPSLAIAFGCAGAFLTGALQEANLPVNLLPLFAALVLGYGVYYLQKIRGCSIY